MSINDNKQETYTPPLYTDNILDPFVYYSNDWAQNYDNPNQ